jgi:hypothetical protein
MLARLPVAIVAQCVAALSLRDHSALARTSRFLGRVILSPAAAIRDVTYCGGLDASTGILPAGLWRLPLHTLDARNAQVTVDELVGESQGSRAAAALETVTTGAEEGDETGFSGATGGKKKRKVCSSASDASDGGVVSAAAVIAARGTLRPAWVGTLRDLALSPSRFVEARIFRNGSMPQRPDTVYGASLRHLERLDTLRILPSSVFGLNQCTSAHLLATANLDRMLCGVARIAALRRLELRGNSLHDYSPLTALPQLEVLAIETICNYESGVTLPWPMPKLRAIAMPAGALPPWPVYPALEEMACARANQRPSPTLGDDIRACCGAGGGGVGGGQRSSPTSSRLRWLSIASYPWLPARSVALLLAALPSLAVLEVGTGDPRDTRYDTETWCLDARYVATRLASWTGHKMGEIVDGDMRSWASEGPRVTAESLLDF